MAGKRHGTDLGAGGRSGQRDRDRRLDLVRSYYDSPEVIAQFLGADSFEPLVWHTQFQVPTPQGDAIDETSFLLRWADVRPDMRVLDFGCGMGSLCRRLAEIEGCRIRGLNLSLRQLAVARRAAGSGPGIGFDLYDGRALPYADGIFDRVLFQESMCHVPARRELLAELARVLAPAGVVAGQDWFAGGEGEPELTAAVDREFRTFLDAPEGYRRDASAAGLIEPETLDVRDVPGCRALERFGGRFVPAIEAGAFTVGFFRASAPPGSVPTAGGGAARERDDV